MAHGHPVLDSLVALGDSFTEGLEDRLPDGSYRGWADLVAQHLAARTPGFRYANLAVRGRRLEHVVAEQLPRAEQLRPSLVTVSAGGNDILGLRCDVEALGRGMADLLERLAATGALVVCFTGFDARGRVPLGRPLAARAARYNVLVTQAAERVGARVVDLWTLPGLYDDRMWCPDRLHMSSDGHALVARAVLRVLELDDAAPEPVDVRPVDDRVWLAARRDDLVWARRHLVPWVGRKLRGRSTGDLLDAKRPELAPLEPRCPA